jgi:mono/diheme cytochrome c family protein
MNSKIFRRSFFANLFNHSKTLSNTFLRASILVFVLFFSVPTFSQDGDPVAGKALFNSNCASCHKLDKKMTGPALRNVEARLLEDEGLDRDWLYKWIRNSSSLIKSGDDYANRIYLEYNKAAMTAYPQLTNVDIDNILAYTAQQKVVPKPVVTAVAAAGPANSTGLTDEIIFGVFTVLFLLLSVGLIVVTKTLRDLAKTKGVKIEEKKKGKPIWKAYLENQFLMLCTAVLFLLVSAYGFYGWTM